MTELTAEEIEVIKHQVNHLEDPIIPWVKVAKKLIASHQAVNDMQTVIVSAIEKAFGKEVLACDGMVMISMHKFNTMVGEINKALSPTQKDE